MRIPASSQHRFSEVPRATIPRSQFNRSFGHKTTFDAGYLIPVLVDEVLPGDTYVCKMTAFARLATPLKPVMDNMYLDSFFFFVPYRLVWTNWQRFNGEQDNPGDSTDFTIPVISHSAAFGIGGLFDYFGIPTGVDMTGLNLAISALPFRAYELIYNEWFRDQNIQNSLVIPSGDGPDPAAGFTLQRRGKRHDYFTSCLPWPQKGESVVLPLGETAPVIGIGQTAKVYGSATVDVWETDATATRQYADASLISANPWYIEGTAAADGVPQIYADLSTATAATINELRQAFQVQKLLERDARGGTRYTEIIRAHFGVTSPDARLQRPEYLGGGSSMVHISPVPQTSEETTGTPQGNLAAFGTVTAQGHGFAKSFTEHGVLIGLVSVRADLTYQQGLERFWSRRTRYDFYWPALAHIGEQAVLQQEIYTSTSQAENETVFGYQERYAEYRYKPSMITGLFRSTAAGSLDVWHLAQDFGGGETWDPVAPPELTADFIVENPPIDRVIAVGSEPHFIMDAYFSMKCARPMPVYGVPGFIDHF